METIIKHTREVGTSAGVLLPKSWLNKQVVVTIFVGYAFFAVAFGSAAFYLFWDLARFKSKKTAMPDAVQEKLAYLDWLTYRLIVVGFPFLTLGIVTGAVWANTCWGRYWSWDPKETWAFITWLIYGVCLHTKYIKEPSGRATALFAFFGFLVMMFTYLGVNFWLASLHLQWGVERSFGFHPANIFPTLITGLFASIAAGFYVGAFNPQRAVPLAAIIPLAFLLCVVVFVSLIFLLFHWHPFYLEFVRTKGVLLGFQFSQDFGLV